MEPASSGWPARGNADARDPAGMSCQKRFRGRAMWGARLSFFVDDAGVADTASSAAFFGVGVAAPNPRDPTSAEKRLCFGALDAKRPGAGAAAGLAGVSSTAALRSPRGLPPRFGGGGAASAPAMDRAAAIQSDLRDWPASRSATLRLRSAASRRSASASLRSLSLSPRSCWSIVMYSTPSALRCAFRSSSSCVRAATAASSTTGVSVAWALASASAAASALDASMSRSFFSMAASWFSIFACSFASARATTKAATALHLRADVWRTTADRRFAA
mmetsp:Transcript_8798/g.30102  ORF Transcript_8798/g.30102 Transcript_8798/m.30102 type:complete len:275 (+) Transcript_8798:1107-1931(+)